VLPVNHDTNLKRLRCSIISKFCWTYSCWHEYAFSSGFVSEWIRPH